MPKAVDIRKGQAVIYEDKLWFVHDAQRVAKGNWRSYMQIKLKNFKTGQVIDNRRVVELPVLNGNSTVAAMLSPGVIIQAAGAYGAVGMISTQTSYLTGDFRADGSPYGVSTGTSRASGSSS